MKLLELFTFSHQTNRDAVSKVAIYFCFRFRTLEKVSKFTLLTNKHDDWEVEGYEKRSLLVICCQEFWQKMPPQKDHNYGILLFLDRQESYHHICIITGKVSLQGLDGVFFMFESRLSWDCCIFKHCLSTKSSGASNYCRHEANVRVLESPLCKVLLSFDNSRLIDRALVFLMYCKLGPEQHPLFLLFTHASLNNKIFFLLLSIKNAPFLTKTIALVTFDV